MTIDDFDLLVLTLWNVPQPQVWREVQDVFSTPPDKYKTYDDHLDLRNIYERAPPRGGAHLARLAVYEPKSLIGKTVTVPNMEDGWASLTHIMAQRLPGEHIAVRTSHDNLRGINELQVYEGKSEVRYVRALWDDDRWEFYEKGVPRPYEDTNNYKRRLIRDRMNRRIALETLKRAGWDLSNPEFWTSERKAYYVFET